MSVLSACKDLVGPIPKGATRMFVIEELPTGNPTGRYKRVVDHERDVWLQQINAGGPDRIALFVLTWKSKAIPFFGQYQVAPPAGYVSAHASNLHWTILDTATVQFGSDQGREGIARVSFADVTEKRQAKLLAAEALLEYGWHYDGRNHDAKRGLTVELDGRVLTRADF